MSTSRDYNLNFNGDRIWQSLRILWEKIRVQGNGLEVTIPIIGSDLSRTDLSQTLLAKLIIISFIAVSKKEFITKKLTVIIYKKDIEYVNLYELDEFLKSTCF